MEKRRIWMICISMIVLGFCACSDAKTAPSPSAPRPTAAEPERAQMDSASTNPQPSVKLYADAKGALADVILKTNPSIVGFGEFHQLHKTAKTRSALDRFRGDLLPLLAPASSDLIIETWVPKGCGEVETQVVKEVNEVTQRPQETENETVQLINSAKAAGVTPHILDVKCEQYESLFDTDGEMDFLAMLELIGQLLGETAQKVVAYRKNKPAGVRQRVLIYGGAIHNDLLFADEWSGCTFGPILQKKTKKYIAVDLYVPEFIEDSDLLKEESWYALYREHVSGTMAVLIEKAPNSFIIVFRRGVKNIVKK